MLNNKGFAVSSVLYTLLIAFLLFLGAALAQFSASSSLIGKANDDLVNGTSFEAMQIKPNGACDSDNGKSWYQDGDGNISDTIVRIKSKYGTIYWPKDFKDPNFSVNGDSFSAKTATSNNDKITAEFISNTSSDPNAAKFRLKIYYSDNSGFAKYSDGSSDADGLGIYDLCQ